MHKYYMSVVFYIRGERTRIILLCVFRVHSIIYPNENAFKDFYILLLACNANGIIDIRTLEK